VTTRQNGIGRRYAGSGFERIELVNGARWLFETMSPEAGRGLSLDHLHLDELRHARSESDGLAALEPTTTARPRGLVLVTSNAGTADSAVLNGLIERGRAAAGGRQPSGEPRLVGVVGFSDAALDDGAAWAVANPRLGYTLDPEVLENAATSSRNTFRTERLSILVTTDRAAIDAGAWAECADQNGTLTFARARIGVAVDTSPDGHTTMCAAGLDTTGTVRVEVLAAWSSPAEARERSARAGLRGARRHPGRPLPPRRPLRVLPRWPAQPRRGRRRGRRRTAREVAGRDPVGSPRAAETGRSRPRRDATRGARRSGRDCWDYRGDGCG
jgi:hypothetical protein